MPSGKPLINRNTILKGAGTIANNNQANQAIPTKTITILSRPNLFNSEINLIP